MVRNIGTHRTHCCAQHGCKYSYESDCPVENGVITQQYPCEWCVSVADAEKALEEAKQAIRQAQRVTEKMQSFAANHQKAVVGVRNALTAEETGSLEGEAEACLAALKTLSWEARIPEASENIIDELIIFIRDNSTSSSTLPLSEEIVDFFENKGWETSPI